MLSILRIAIRNVVRNTRRSLITAAAILFGIGVLVAMRGFVTGFQRTIITSVAEGRMGMIQVHRAGYLASEEVAPLSLSMAGDPAFLGRLQGSPGVFAAAPRVAFSSMVNLGDETAFAQVTAIDPSREYAAVPRSVDNVESGRLIRAPGEALIGTELARSLHAKLGDKVTFLTGDKDGVLNAVEVTLVGLIAFKTPGDKRVAQLELSNADELLRLEGQVTEFAIRTDRAAGDDFPALQRVKAGLQETLGDGYQVSTWNEVAAWLDDVVTFQNIMFSIIGFVFIIVALTGITNTMLMSVLERVREIGTMMALGVRRRSIVALFLAESATLGFLGGLAGAALGSLLVFWLGKHGIDLPMPGTTVPNIIRPQVSLGYDVFAVSLSVVGSVVSALYPSSKAAKMRPVEALSHV
jgi:putative ABC transport system permease protein